MQMNSGLSYRLPFLFFICISIVSPSPLQSAQLRTVAFKGQRAEGTPNGVTYGTLTSLPVLNDFGETVFRATLVGAGVTETTSQGIWSEGGGSLHLVARAGSELPGLPDGAVFKGFYFGGPLLSNSGVTTIVAALNNTGTDSQGIYSSDSGILAVTGRELPGGTIPVSFNSFVQNESGRVAFDAFYAPNSFGIWSQGAGELKSIVRQGDEIPDLPGAHFEFASAPLLNNAGETAFIASVGYSSGQAGAGIWVHADGSYRRAAIRGQDAPDLPSAATFLSFGSLALNDFGKTAFQAQVLNGGVSGGIWSEGSGAVGTSCRRWRPRSGHARRRQFL